MPDRDRLMDRIDELEEIFRDLSHAGEWSAAQAVQQDLAELYDYIEMVA